MPDPQSSASATSSGGGNPVWTVRPDVELHGRDWGGDSVAFEARSGQIYRFDPLSAAVIGCIEERPSSTAQISEQLARDLGLEDAQELTDAVDAIIDNGRALGWIAPIIDA